TLSIKATNAADTIDEMEHLDTTAEATSKATQLLVALDKQMHVVDEINVATERLHVGDEINVATERLHVGDEINVATERRHGDEINVATERWHGDEIKVTAERRLQMHVVDEIKVASERLQRRCSVAFQ
ncbi:hypothetical protein KC331_g3502, partial [Hortaea werneckii]